MQNTSDEVKARLAKLCMDDPTIHWLKRCGGRHYDNPFKELSDLRQTGSVENISSRVFQLSEEQYPGYFMGGFQPELCCWVCTFRLQPTQQVADDEDSS